MEIETSYGWIEVAGHADRSAYDLSSHSKVGIIERNRSRIDALTLCKPDTCHSNAQDVHLVDPVLYGQDREAYDLLVSMILISES